MTVLAWSDTLLGGDALTERALLGSLDRLDPDTRRVCGYHLGFWDQGGTPASGAGKGLRPALVLLSATAAGAPAGAAVPAAAACELVHNFSLLHDDVMDRDLERRHRPAAWVAFGVPAAVLAGDAMLALAVELLAEAPGPTTGWAIRCLTAATRRLIAGQAADLSFEDRTAVSLAECEAMARDKTGALLECAASLGAVLVDAPGPLVLGLAEVGAHLGMAFQLTDDLLGLWGDPARTGKPVLSDLRSRKKSLPIVFALTSGTDAGAELADVYRSPAPPTGDGLVHAATLIERAGGRSWAERRADQELDAALAQVRALDLEPTVTAEFSDIVGRLRGRDR